MAAARQKNKVIPTRQYCVTYIQAYFTYWQPYLFDLYEVNSEIPEGQQAYYPNYPHSFLHAGVDVARYDFIVELLQKPDFDFDRFVKLQGIHPNTKRDFKSIFEYIYDNYFDGAHSLHDNAVHRDFIENVFFLLLIHGADPNLLSAASYNVSHRAPGFEHFKEWHKSKSQESAAQIAALIKKKNNPKLEGYYSVWLQRSLKPFSKEWFDQYAKIYSTATRPEAKQLVIKDLEVIVNSKPAVADEKKEEKAAAEQQLDLVNAARAQIILARILLADDKPALVHFSAAYEKLSKLPSENFTPDEIFEAHVFHLSYHANIVELNEFLLKNINQINLEIIERIKKTLPALKSRVSTTIFYYYIEKLRGDHFKKYRDEAIDAIKDNPVFLALKEFFGWDNSPKNRWKTVAILQEQADIHFDRKEYAIALWLYHHNTNIYSELLVANQDLEVYKKYLLQAENQIQCLIQLNWVNQLYLINDFFKHARVATPEECQLFEDLLTKLYFYASSKPDLQKRLLVDIYERKFKEERNPELSKVIAEALLMIYSSIPIGEDSDDAEEMLARLEGLKPYLKDDDVKTVDMLKERCYVALNDAESLDRAYKLSNNPHILFRLAAAHVQDEKQIAQGIEDLHKILRNVNEERLFNLATSKLLETRKTAIPHTQKIDEALLAGFRSLTRWSYMEGLKALTLKLLKEQRFKMNANVMDEMITVILLEIDLKKDKELIGLLQQYCQKSAASKSLKELVDNIFSLPRKYTSDLQKEFKTKRNLLAIDYLAAVVFKDNIRRRLTLSMIILLITNNPQGNVDFKLPEAVIASIRSRAILFIETIKNKAKHKYKHFAEECYHLYSNISKCSEVGIKDYLAFLGCALPSVRRHLLWGINQGLGFEYGSWASSIQSAEFVEFTSVLSKMNSEAKAEDGRAAASAQTSTEWENEPGFEEGEGQVIAPAAAAPIRPSAPPKEEVNDEGQSAACRPSSPGQKRSHT